MNIGTNPTVDGKVQSIEVHFFNFNQDIYGKILEVEILERLRDEQKFDSLEDLKNQLSKDFMNSNHFLNQNDA
jgi:riboflavin kinase/FMN adenylyltransferase